jgi:Xaa-Pro aminopeptidase
LPQRSSAGSAATATGWRSRVSEGCSDRDPDLVTMDLVPTDLVPMDTAGRLDRLRDRMDGEGLDALLVTHLTNIRYLTGFTGSAALLLVTAHDALFVTDGRYSAQSADQLGAAGVAARIEVSGEAQRDLVVDAATGESVVGLEADHVTWSAARRYGDEWFGDADVVATTGLTEGLRIVKDAGEIDRIRAACAIADDALAEVRHRLAERPTEREFGFELDMAIRRLGASGNSFDTIVASGPNGARPHHRPTDRVVEEGDLVVIDFGALVDGYCSDMTRTVMVGEATPTQSRMLATVLESQTAGVEAVRAGIEARVVDAACRLVIDDAGWSAAFSHGTGHGVGLDIHESPRVAKTSGDTLAAGHIVTVEPGVYLPEHGGVRIEDTVVVTDAGCEPLTLTSKATSVA